MNALWDTETNDSEMTLREARRLTLDNYVTLMKSVGLRMRNEGELPSAPVLAIMSKMLEKMQPEKLEIGMPNSQACESELLAAAGKK